MNKLYWTVLFLIICCSSRADIIYMKLVEGGWTQDGVTKITPECEVTFLLHAGNTGSNATEITNGFRIWTIGETPYDPLSATTNPFYDVDSMFPLAFSISYFSADGIGSDTVGYHGRGGSGFGRVREPFFFIKTGNIQEGETLCIDSSYFPQSLTNDWYWLWEGPPDWGGPYCYTAEYPTDTPQFNVCPESLIVYNCDFKYFFSGTNDNIADSSIRYRVTQGPGYIDSSSGWYEYTPTDNELGTIQLLELSISNTFCSEFIEYCQIELNIQPSYNTIDINFDCKSDVADIVYLISYMFAGGDPPRLFVIADVNSSGLIEIADLVYIVDYMFNGGPPPVG